MKKTKYAFIDIETTGLDCYKHEIIEIAILTDSQKYHVKVSPQRLDIADSKALEINGYNSKDWDGAVRACDVALKTSNMLEGCVIVGHNPGFDMGFLGELWELYNCNPYIDKRYIDTIVLAREHLPRCRSYSLDSIRDYLGWSKIGNHSALIDCEDTERLFRLLWRCSIWKRVYFSFRHWLISWFGKK